MSCLIGPHIQAELPSLALGSPPNASDLVRTCQLWHKFSYRKRSASCGSRNPGPKVQLVHHLPSTDSHPVHSRCKMPSKAVVLQDMEIGQCLKCAHRSCRSRSPVSLPPMPNLPPAPGRPRRGWRAPRLPSLPTATIHLEYRRGAKPPSITRATFI